MASSTGLSELSPSGSVPRKNGLHILDLPYETLSAIFSYAAPSDLVSLCQVSKTVREVAVAHLYHSLTHEFPGFSFEEPPVDRLAAILETLVTSDFDYASFIKEINLEASYSADSDVADEFSYAKSCGKFLNTLILAILKKVKSLESFRWDIRVQMSPSLFEILGKLTTLHHLHVRLHPESSLVNTTLPGQNFPDGNCTFSKFGNLKSLAVVEMDTLEYLDEIARCISSSAGTLKSLKLSISEKLATKARTKANSESDSAVSVNWHDPADLTAAEAAAGAANDPDVRRERIQQEKILSTIFSLDREQKTSDPRDPLERIIADAISSAYKKSREIARASSEALADKSFVKELRSIVRDLRKKKASEGSRSSQTWKAIERLQKAADAYLEQRETADNLAMKEEGLGSSVSPEGAANNHDITGDDAIASSSLPGGSTDPENLENHILDIVDIEHPDDVGEEVEDQEFVNAIEKPPETNSLEGDQAVESKNDHVGKKDDEPADKALEKGKQPMRVSDPNDHNSDQCKNDILVKDREVHEYVRSRHGLPLEDLSIYLIPVKPSVLCGAVDIWALKHISLLDVGPQRSIWATLEKLHESNPLQLSSIHTDNVSPEFLDLVNSLNHVKELFMFERNSGATRKSSAPKTTVTIDDIRMKVLLKHIDHLEYLVIRNDNDMSWSLNRDSVNLMTRHGNRLKELVVAFKSAPFHLFIQGISRLRSLKVLHILFSSSDTCQAVLREVQSCALDHVVRLPFLKIKYIAVSNGTEEPRSTGISRIDRRTIAPLQAHPSESRRLSNSSSSQSSFLMSYPNEVPDSNAIKESDRSSPWISNEDEFAVEPASRTSDSLNVPEVVEGLVLEDIKDVRVWEKDIWNIRL
ncbi:hypothetical protein VTO42DRAFT_2549 [Malbranchea cinnamomea]